MGVMTITEVIRRKAAGQLPSEISLLAWERQLKIVNKLGERHFHDLYIWAKIENMHQVCALCETFVCGACTLAKATGVSCLNYKSPYSDVRSAEYMDDYVEAIKRMIEALKACVELERTLVVGAGTNGNDDAKRN